MTVYPTLSMIVARAKNGVIGRDGDLPWRLGSDLKFFKATTMGKPMLMGRRTWESLPGRLPGRPHLVLTRTPNYTAQGAEIFSYWQNMVARGFELAGELNVNEVCVVGGAMLYSTLLPYANKLYLSDVGVEIEGDTIFPDIDMSVWRETFTGPMVQTPQDDYAYRVRVYERGKA